MSSSSDAFAVCSPQEAQQRQGAGAAQLVDVRTPAEYRAVHAVGAEPRPLEDFDAAAVAAAVPAGATAHLLCKSGGRARQAAQRLVAAGCACAVVEGGTDAWVAAGLPVVRGRAVMSLERQVRIVAGSIVVVGVVLAFTVHPYWAALSGGIGAGLAIAGLTDTCMLGMLIARLPWNR